MLLYGRNVAREVLKSEMKIYEVFVLKTATDVDDILQKFEKRKIPVTRLDKRELDRKAGTDKNQGIVLNVEGIKSFTIDEFLKKHENKEEMTVAILDGIEDPHNLGAIIRSCEIFGVCGIIMAHKNSAPVNDVVFKTSAGALSFVDLVKVSNINNALEKLKENGFWIYGFDLKAEKYLDEVEFDAKSALVFGSEGRGMKQLVAKNCDFLLKIRQRGTLDSLNVSNAAAVAFYEVMKQK